MRAGAGAPAARLVGFLVVTFSASAALAQSPEDGASALEADIARLSSEDATVRLDAVRALGERGDPAAIDALSRTARTDERPEIRGWALRSLHQIGTPEALAVVRVLSTSDEDERVRRLGEGLLATAEPPQHSVPDPFEADLAPSPAQPPVTPSPAGAAVQPAAQPPVVVVQPQVSAPAELLALRLQRRAQRRGRGLIAGGWVLFGLSYGPSFISGIFVATLDSESSAWPLFIPVIGPFISAAEQLNAMDDCVGYDDICVSDDNKGVAAAFNLLGGFMQIAAVAMLIPGYIRRSRARQETTASPRQGVRLAVLPSGPGDGPGLSLAATF